MPSLTHSRKTGFGQKEEEGSEGLPGQGPDQPPWPG